MSIHYKVVVWYEYPDDSLEDKLYKSLNKFKDIEIESCRYGPYLIEVTTPVYEKAIKIEKFLQKFIISKGGELK